MPTLYNVMLLAHILAVVTWVGSVVTMGSLTTLCVLRREHATLASLLRTSATFAPTVAMSAALVTLVAGMSMMEVAGLEPDLWTGWGFVSIGLSLVASGVFIRPTTAEVLRLAPAPTNEPRLRASEQRLVLLSGCNAFLLTSAIVAMVMKPSF